MNIYYEGFCIEQKQKNKKCLYVLLLSIFSDNDKL